MAKRPDNSDPQAELRIIAGRWRGRKLRFAASHIRPTGDRVRETLFNWLAPDLPGAHCLDLFAGSGALGIEALSRDAASVVFVEREARAAARIKDHLALFAAKAGCYRVLNKDARRLQLAKLGPFDIVFLDPPFREALPEASSRREPTSTPAVASQGPEMAKLCTLLENSGALASRCLIYMELDRADALPSLPSGWQVRREKTAGQVRYALAERMQA